MTRNTLLVAVLAACGDNRQVADIADAPVDAEIDAPVSCCRFYPDTDAVRACAVPTFQVGSCGVLACPDGMGGFARVNVCNRLPKCDTLDCVALACEEQTPNCTCELPSGTYVSCDDHP